MDNKISIDGKEVVFDFKEVSQREMFELDKYYRQIFGECIKAGLMTEKQAARLYEKNGSWGKEQEQEIAKAAMRLNELSEKIKEFDEFNDDSKKIMSEMITLRADLTSLVGEKIELFRQTAEGTANQERILLFIRIATVGEDKKPLFDTNEDLETYSFENQEDFGKLVTSAYLSQQGMDKDRDLTDDWEEVQFLNRANKKEEEKAKKETTKKASKPRTNKAKTSK